MKNKEKLDDLAQNANEEDMFEEVGPRKTSLSFSGAKDAGFLDKK